MIPIMDFQRRAVTGPVMKTDDFDIEFAMKVRELVSKYEIKYDPERLVVDDATADAVFQAGVELLADIGLYHMGTQRVIQYSREEIEEGIRNRGVEGIERTNWTLSMVNRYKVDLFLLPPEKQKFVGERIR